MEKKFTPTITKFFIPWMDHLKLRLKVLLWSQTNIGRSSTLPVCSVKQFYRSVWHQHACGPLPHIFLLYFPVHWKLNKLDLFLKWPLLRFYSDLDLIFYRIIRFPHVLIELDLNLSFWCQNVGLFIPRLFITWDYGFPLKLHERFLH